MTPFLHPVTARPALPARRLLLGSAMALGLGSTGALLTGCAALGGVPALRVSLAGIDPLPGEGLEWRFTARLRLQNPSESDLAFDGVSIDIELRGLPFASGVSAQRGTLPRFSERVLGVPVTVPATALVRQGLSLLRSGGEPGRIAYALNGRLGGNLLGGLTGSTRFEASGEIDWPPGPPSVAPSVAPSVTSSVTRPAAPPAPDEPAPRP